MFDVLVYANSAAIVLEYTLWAETHGAQNFLQLVQLVCLYVVGHNHWTQHCCRAACWQPHVDSGVGAWLKQMGVCR